VLTSGGTGELVLKVGLGLLPVTLFLVVLVYLDSYKLVRLRRIMLLIGVGCAAAVLSYAGNQLAVRLVPSQTLLTGIIAPVLEELLKGAVIVVLMRARRIGFLADAAIQSFAIGTGFALVENVYYLIALPSSSVGLWLIRGFGTAMMHGGATAMFAMISKGATQRLDRQKLTAFVPGLAAAALIHAAFNRFVMYPLLATLFVLLVLPLLLTVFFSRSERRLQAWLGSGFDMDTELLRLIHSGDFTSSPIGLYLKSLRMFYPGPVVADMLCYLGVHVELALRAKGILMMRENGFSVPRDPSLREKLEELEYLKKSIGKTAMSSLTPILRSSEQDLWQLEVLQSS
jgi:protease PrsW